MKNKNYGLTLIEILVIVAIISILAAILYPVILGAGKGGGREPICTSNQRQIVAHLQMYAQEHNEDLPLSSNIWKDIKVDPAVLICPQDKSLKNGYLYNNNLSGISLGELADPTTKIATVDGKTTIDRKRKINNIYYTPSDVLFRHYIKEKNIYFTPASYADGHIEMLTKVTEPQSWDKLPVKKKTGGKK